MRHNHLWAALATVGVLGLAAPVATAGSGPYHSGFSGDQAVAWWSGWSGEFRLNSKTLEPGCFDATSNHRIGGVNLFVRKNSSGGYDKGYIHFQWDTDVDGHVDVTQNHEEAHVTVESDAPFSIDQVLVPAKGDGYAVYNTFDTGSVSNDEDIDPTQTATDLAAPGNAWVDEEDIIVCISDHPTLQNEPYEAAAGGEVAAKNRPIIQPTVAALGVSAIEPLNTYKVGFGYEVERWYDFFWYAAFNTDRADGFWWGDPQAFFTTTAWNEGFSHVYIKDRPEQPGVRRYNDIDEFGEQFNDPHSEKSSYGQPEVFNRDGDPYAYLHKSLPGAVDGGYYGDTWLEMMADQTEESGLLTFTTQGDLPIRWALKASLAPERYGRSVELTDDEVRAWEASWQAFYEGKGPKPALPLAPGTNSPAPKPGIVVNLPQTATVTPAGTVEQQAVKGVTASATVNRSTRIAKVRFSKRIKRAARIVYWSADGLKSVKGIKVGRRYVAMADLRGLPMNGERYAILVKGKTKKGAAMQYVAFVRL